MAKSNLTAAEKKAQKAQKEAELKALQESNKILEQQSPPADPQDAQPAQESNGESQPGAEGTNPVDAGTDVTINRDLVGYDPDTDQFVDTSTGEVIAVEDLGEDDYIFVQSIKSRYEAAMANREDQAFDPWADMQGAAALPDVYRFGGAKGKEMEPGAMIRGEYYGMGPLPYFGQAREFGTGKPLFNEDGTQKWNHFAFLWDIQEKKWWLIAVNGNMGLQLSGCRKGDYLQVQYRGKEKVAKGMSNQYHALMKANPKPSQDKSVDWADYFQSSYMAYKASKES